MGDKYVPTDITSRGAGSTTVSKDDVWTDKKAGNVAHETYLNSYKENWNLGDAAPFKDHKPTHEKKKKEGGYINKTNDTINYGDINPKKR